MCLMVYKSLNTVSHNQNTILQSAYCVFHVNFGTALFISRGQRQGGGLETLLFLSRIKQKINKKRQPEFHKSYLTSWIWARGKTRSVLFADTKYVFGTRIGTGCVFQGSSQLQLVV